MRKKETAVRLPEDKLLDEAVEQAEGGIKRQPDGTLSQAAELALELRLVGSAIVA